VAPPVYTLFIADIDLTFGESVNLGPVPGGKRWIVVDVTGTIVNDTQPTLISLVWQRSTSNLQSWQCPAYGRRDLHWSGRQVYNAGNAIVFDCPGTAGSGPHCYASVTAYELALP
jgi:hypothetical protein